MKTGNTALMLAALLAFALANGDAWAKGGSGGGSGGHGGRGHASAGGGKGSHHNRGSHYRPRWGSTSGFYGSYWAFPAYWLAGPAFYAPAEPVYYIEKSEAELQTDAAWFYCESEAAYYPYVTRCPVGWVKVAPFVLP